MTRQVNLDTALLRTLLAIADLGSFSQAAAALGRTQSAISLQVKRLEELTGTRIFARNGRNPVLTPAGEVLVSYARRMLALNDEALDAMRSSAIGGKVRFGTSQDFSETWLPTILQGFVAANPGIEIEVRVDSGIEVVNAVEAGELDIALALGLGELPSAEVLGQVPLVWIGRSGFRPVARQPLPLVLFPAPCRFRHRALILLDRHRIGWRIALTSPSLSGLWSAVTAGLGITVRTPEGIPAGLTVLDRCAALPPLGSVDVALHTRGGFLSPAAETLQAMMRQSLAGRLAQLHLRYDAAVSA